MIHVVGLGLGPPHLAPATITLIEESAFVAGGSRLLDILAIPVERRIPFTSVKEFAESIRLRADTNLVCVLADGDPLLFGIGATLLRYFSAEKLRFHPNISAIQAACARFRLPWHDCEILSLHGRDDLAPLYAALTRSTLVALFTDPGHDPAFVASALLHRAVSGWRMHVAEDLCGPQERLSSQTLEEAVTMRWHSRNVVLLELTDTPPNRLRLGLSEAEIVHERGLMTKLPVRALALSLLRLDSGSHLWDLGAGSGVLSLEAARLVSHGRVTAVERNAARVRDITENRNRFGAWQVEIVHAALEDFLQHGHTRDCPDRVFFGGGVTPQTLHDCCDLLRPGGRMVATAVLLSTLDCLHTTLNTLGWPASVHQLMHHACSPLGGSLRFIPSNPVFLIETQKPS